MSSKIKVTKFSRSKVSIPETIPESIQENVEPETETVDSSDYYADSETDNDGGFEMDDDFLNDLENDKFVSQLEIEKSEKQREKEEKEREKEERKRDRIEKKMEQQSKKVEQTQKKTKQIEEDQLFSEKGSELWGRDRIVLISKIQQYKVLFPDNKKIQQLKIKKNATVEDLQNYLTEMDALVSCGTVEQFITDSILESLKMVELVSSRTKYNIKGLAETLNKNPQFHALAKQLYLKYGVFSKIPPEQQMVMLVATSTWVCYEKNKQDEKSKDVLNKTVNINDFN